jgi:hypothetical protein
MVTKFDLDMTDTQLFITPPGLYIPHDIWEYRILCKVVGNTYKGDSLLFADIAILDSGSFYSKHYLQLSSIAPPFNSMVDVVGYTGKISQEWLDFQWRLRELTDVPEAGRVSFPEQCLTLTCGTIIETGASTITVAAGMSGSCVLYQGRFVGRCFILRGLTK